MKLEKLMNKLAKEIKMDKFNIIYMMMGDKNMKKLEKMLAVGQVGGGGEVGKPDKVDKANSPHNQYRPVSVGSQRYNTAQGVYNNLDKANKGVNPSLFHSNSHKPDIDWGVSP